MGGAEEGSGKQNIRQKSLKIIMDLCQNSFCDLVFNKMQKNYNALKKIRHPVQST